MAELNESLLPNPTSASVSPRRVLLRRPLQAVPSASEIPSEDSAGGAFSPSSERRKVLLAHRIKPGQTIQLKASRATATMREEGQPEMQAESLVQNGRPAPGPQYGDGGNLLSFSVLGPVEEFADQSDARTVAGMINEALNDETHSSFEARLEGSARALVNQLDADVELARSRSEYASARQRHSEVLAAQQARAWKAQMAALATELNLPASSLMMARTGEYRGRVQQREVLEALRRRQHPYGGDRAWQIGLRSGGVFYEAIGNPSNGIFCPFRAPNDAEALARVGSLAAKMDEPEVTLAGLEAKILGEQQSVEVASDGIETDTEVARRDPRMRSDAASGNDDDVECDEFVDPEAFDVVSVDHLHEIQRLRDKYNIEGAAPSHLSGDERVLWGIFKEIDTDESGEVSKQELYAAFAKMGLIASAAEMLRLFREGDVDGNGRIDCDEFIALGQKVDVFANAAKAFTTTDRAVQKTRRRKAKIAVNKGSQLGPRLTISAQCLGFEALVGERVDQGIDMMNSGSTCIYYEWQRAPTSAGFGATASGDAAAQFFASSACGCILPGAHVDMRFTFQPVKAGVFQEEWRLKFTPQKQEPTARVTLRGVCLSVPEREHQVRALDADLERRKAWYATQAILRCDVLPAVYLMTIPASERVDAVAASRRALLPELTRSAASGFGDADAPAVEARFAVFMRSHGAMQGLASMNVRACFEALDEIAASLSVQWNGNFINLEEALEDAGENGIEAWERLEAELQQAASATLNVSRLARLRHAGAVCVEGAVLYGADSLVRVRRLFSKTTGGILAPEHSSDKLMRAGDTVAWCWETGQYERASEMDTVSASARGTRKKAEMQAAVAREREAQKAGMTKRERKKAEEKDRKEMEAAAVAAAAAAAFAQEKMRIGHEAEERRLADPFVQKDIAYHKQMASAVNLAVSCMVDNFVAQGAAVENV